MKRYLSSLIFAVCVFGFASCAALDTDSPTPDYVEDTTISWDGSEQNGGIIDYTEKGYLITKNAADRYLWLTQNYRNSYDPPMEEGMGLTEDGGKFYLNESGMVEFMVLNGQHKSGIDPKYFKRDNVK